MKDITRCQNCGAFNLHTVTLCTKCGEPVSSSRVPVDLQGGPAASEPEPEMKDPLALPPSAAPKAAGLSPTVLIIAAVVIVVLVLAVLLLRR